ncbi:MAG TPA: ABC transporter permease [Bryobacteraceae bacterium]|jgi:putative ABC transport system permease protein|nr:ABC transporter permease [Bryobacteraceae bacterium]
MNIGRDLRYALRAMRRNPGFSAIAIATLALGIGANTAIFSVVDGILIRPLGYGDEGRLVAVHEIVPKFASFTPLIPANAMHFLEWRKSVNAFEQIALIGGLALNLTGAGEPERLVGARVSPDLFPMLRAQIQLGRTLLPEEDQPGRDHVVVLSNELWKRRFASNPRIVGQKLVLDGQPYEVVGVLSANFHFPKISQLYAMSIVAERPELWKPFAARPDEIEPMGDFNYACIARLRQGVSLKQAGAELNRVQANLAKLIPDKTALLAAMVPLQDQITGRSRSGLQLMLLAVGAVLLIVCVNIANLLLARATASRRELAIRAAVGASARSLLQQMVAESLLLAAIGGALGVLVAYGTLHLILVHAPVDLPRLDEVHLDARVLAFTTGISVVAGLLFGLIPARQVIANSPQEAMKARARGTTEGHTASKLRTLLVGLEVGLGTLCLTTGGLLLHSYANLLQADKGFAAQQIISINLNLPDTRYPEHAERVRFMDALLHSVGSLPGVASVGISNMLPLSGEGGNNILSLEGTQVPFNDRPVADIRGVNRDYFRTLNISLRRGRVFEPTDRDHKVGLVSAMTAERVWPGQNPLGKRFKVGDPDGPFFEVVGVVGDVRSAGLDKSPSMTVYLPYWQRRTWGGPSVVIKTTMGAAALSPLIRKVIHRLDSELPIPQFQTMEQVVAESLAQRRFQMNVILLFAVAALLLASLGVYGVISYSVALRTNEMGVRIAVGASGGDVLRMVLRQGLTPVALGLCGGLIFSFAARRLLSGLLYGIAGLDFLTMGSVVLTLAIVAAIASIIPAWRAARIDPLNALRWE